MSAFQAYRMGFEIAVIEKQKNSPAGQLTKNEFVGWVDDENLIKKIASVSDVLTLENEFIEYKVLEYIENLGKKVMPSSYTISLIQDKLIQKEVLAKVGIPVPNFVQIHPIESYGKIAEKLGTKFLIKSRKMGYDGYGNFLVKNQKDFQTGQRKLSERYIDLMAEELIDFEKELAVMVVRSKKEIKVYPVVETIQKNHICHTVIAPAQISKKTSGLIKEIAVESVKIVKGFGIFGIEFFLSKQKKIYVNEMAPRPHNSGHYTIEACTTSQFENHLRAVLNLPLGSVDMIKSFAVMINLLGKRNGDGTIKHYSNALKYPDAHLHIYGKEESRIGRKMGHVTVIGDKLQTCLLTARKTEKEILI
jgi:5-(carboxyamino)imidazole ribonucleotide synthase